MQTCSSEKGEKLVEVITHYVGADWTEGIGATHIEMGAIEPQKNFDVVEAISLYGNKRRESQVHTVTRNS